MDYKYEKYVDVFLDTLQKCKQYPRKEIESAVYYNVDTMNELAEKHSAVEEKYAGKCKVTVSGDDSYRAARRIKEADASANVLVLNFANSISQGGGVRFGARAQEEDLCRTSTLYESLMSESAYSFYDYNRVNDLNEKGSDTAIYSPHVYIIKDENYQDIEPVEVSVVTMAAPINRNGLNTIDIMDQRIYKLLCLAEELGHKTLILGAWGCGAFGNDPEDVAQLFRKNLEKFDCFTRVVFAVRHVSTRGAKNYLAFQGILEDGSS